jgi:hypothetical protein
MIRPAFIALTCLALAGSPALGQSLSERIGYVRQQQSQAAAANASKARMLSTLLYNDLTVQF